MGFDFSTQDYEETMRMGRALGEALRSGCVVALTGDLGAGKTCLIKGIARGLCGIDEADVTSPTFTLLQEYEGRMPLYHFDAYRLAGSEDLENIGFEDYVGGEGVSVIEWADRIADAIPAECLLVDIDYVDENARRFSCRASGPLHEAVLENFREKTAAVSPELKAVKESS